MMVPSWLRGPRGRCGLAELRFHHRARRAADGSVGAAILGMDRRSRRVIAKAEWLPGATAESGAANPRLIVTSLKHAKTEARHLYEAIFSRLLSRIRSVDQRLAIGFAAGTDSQVHGMAGKSPLSATEEQRAALTVLASSRDRGEADRARAVLLTLAGWTSPRIAEAFGVREDTVRLWRSDFMSGGVEALEASVAPGPAPVKSEAALRVVTPLLEEPVADRRNWTIPRRASVKSMPPIGTVSGQALKTPSPTTTK